MDERRGQSDIPGIDTPGIETPEDEAPEDDSPTGGDETTEEQLDADNPVEEDTLKTLDPDSPPA